MLEEHAFFLHEEVINPVLEEVEVGQFLELVKFKIEDELKSKFYHEIPHR